MNTHKVIQVLFLPHRNYSLKSGVAQISGLGKKSATLTPKMGETINVEVEKDAKKLVSQVCGTNLFVEGGENVKIKPDSEYPKWLWSIGKPLPLEELDRNDKEFWRRVRNMGLKEDKYLRSLIKTSTVHK